MTKTFLFPFFLVVNQARGNTSPSSTTNTHRIQSILNKSNILITVGLQKKKKKSYL